MAFYTLHFPCGLGERRPASPKGDRQLEAEAHESPTALPGIRHPSDAGRRSRLLDVPGTLLRRETVPTGLPCLQRVCTPSAPSPHSWINGFWVPCLPSLVLGEKRSGLDRRIPHSAFPPLPCARPCYSFLGLLLQFSVFCLIYSMQKSH